MTIIRRGPSPWMPQYYVRWIDKDRDGIPDKFEEELLRRYRPYYKFSKCDILTPLGPLPFFIKDENYRPCDAVWQVKYAQLMDSDWTDWTAVPNVIETCGAPPDYHVDPPSQLLTCLGDETNLMKTPKKTRYFLNIDDDKRSGPSWDEAVANAPGLFGHVVPDGDNIYKIEYWQFFGYNGVDKSVGPVYGGDHEGDWCTVQLWYNTKEKRLIRTAHYAHGKGMCFDLEKTIRRIVINIDGLDMVECQGPAYNADPGSLHTDERYPNNYQNNAVRFYVDQEGNEHVVVYIERDSHEFWPTEYGEFPAVNEHNGKGYSYLTANNPASPLNLGEVEYPLSADAQIILWFNGYWGCYHHPGQGFPPPGPALHREWTWPVKSKLHTMINDDDFEW